MADRFAGCMRSGGGEVAAKSDGAYGCSASGTLRPTKGRRLRDGRRTAGCRTEVEPRVAERRSKIFGGDVRQDAEGMQTMRTLGKNMAFLIKSIRLGKEAYGLPEKEEHVFTNFIR